MPENTGKVQDTKFKRGVSGNPNGRPKGSRNKATIAAYTLLEGEADNITRKLVDEALEGNLMAIKLCMDRIAAPVKHIPIKPLDLPTLTDAASIPLFYERLNDLLSNGELSLDELSGLNNMVSAFSRSIDLAELEQRITAIENSNDKN